MQSVVVSQPGDETQHKAGTEFVPRQSELTEDESEDSDDDDAVALVYHSQTDSTWTY